MFHAVYVCHMCCFQLLKCSDLQFNTITNGVFEDVPFDHKNIDRLMDNENYSKS